MSRKYWRYTDGTARWKYDSPFENWLSRRADSSECMKALYVGFYRLIDGKFYKNGMKFVNREIDNYISLHGELPMSRKRMVRDMVYSLHRFGSMFNEYFIFEFYKKNAIGRDEYICDKMRWDYYRQMNKTENLDIFNNKGRTYELFREFYGRELLCVQSEAQKADFVDFVRRHDRIMVKPIDGTAGRGIGIYSVSEAEAGDFFDRTLSEGAFVAEELIIQSPEMAQFHPSSLNTVRLTTILSGGKVVVFGPVLRVGTGGSIVDNASAGGFVAGIDEETGCVVTKACNKAGQSFIRHPDTGVTIVGFQLPEWDKAVELASKLAGVVEGNRYTGWDLAHTDSGWVMVEGNARGEFLSQIPDKIGRKQRLFRLMEAGE